MNRATLDTFEATDGPLTDREIEALRHQISSPLVKRFLQTIDMLRAERDDDDGIEMGWLTDHVYEGRGAVLLSMTENGNVGVWIGVPEGETPALGTGDTALQAIRDALQRASGTEQK